MSVQEAWVKDRPGGNTTDTKIVLHVFGEPLTEITACVRMNLLSHASRCQKKLTGSTTYADLPVHNADDPVKIFFSWTAGQQCQYEGHQYGIATWNIQTKTLQSGGVSRNDTFILRLPSIVPGAKKIVKLAFTFGAALDGSIYRSLPGELFK